MKKNMLTTPIAFFIFNRSDRAQRVFATIRAARPERLFIIADGPRQNRPGEDLICAETRSIINEVDWDCEVLTNFADQNMGCKKRISSGLDWVFEHAEEAIILEDDCLPSPSFFGFCQEMLERYRDDQRIMLVSGDNFQLSREVTKDSYYFSKCIHIWGWATWRRTWRKYDITMKLWPEVDQFGLLMDVFQNRFRCRKWVKKFNAAMAGMIDTWDYQLVFSIWIQNGLSIVPKTNLVSNIGFGGEATHTTKISRYAEMPTVDLEFPLEHPAYVCRNRGADLFELENEYRLSWGKRLLSFFNVQTRH